MDPLPESHFSHALRLVRRAKGLTQEDFDGVASRVYVSALEREAKKKPSLQVVESMAGRLGVHPLTLLALCYCRKPRQREDRQRYMQAMQEEARQLFQDALAEIETLQVK